MEQPIEPNKEDCCDSGCNPCIFDVYDIQMKLYKKYLETGLTPKDTITCSENAILQKEYTKFKIIQSIEICEQHKCLVFKRNKVDPQKCVLWKPGDHFLFKFNSLDMLCTRAYTPLKTNILDLRDEDYDFAIIVKRYDGGLVSNYLFNLQLETCTLWRGPYGSYVLNPSKFNRLIMIAQGTGIAPFISIIQSILKNEDDMTRIILYFCCPSPDKIILRSELYSYREYWNFKYKVFVMEVTKEMSLKYQEPVVVDKLSRNEFSALEPFTSKDQFILCGSSKFMNEYEKTLKTHYKMVNIFTF